MNKKYENDITTRELLNIFRKKRLNEDVGMAPMMNTQTSDTEQFKSGISPNVKIETYNQNDGNSFVKGYVDLDNTKVTFVYDTTKTYAQLIVDGTIKMTEENTEIVSKIGSFFDIWSENLNKQ